MFPAPHHLSPFSPPFLLLCVEGVTDLPSTHQDEACMLGNFGGAIMGAKYRFALK